MLVEAHRVERSPRGGGGIVDDVLAVVDDKGVVGEQLIGDYSVVLGVEIEQLLRLRLACLDRHINLPTACRLPHPDYY